MTPRIIWQYWDGSMPADVAGWVAGWDAHDGWEHRVLDPTDGRREMTRYPALARVWDEVPDLYPTDTPRKQSDVLRLALLLTHGGVWLDTDMETTGRPLDALVHLGPALCWENPGVAAIGMIASPPDTPYLHRVAADFPAAHLRRFAPSAKGDNPTGPLYWSHHLGPDVTVLAKDVCYPFGWRDWPEPNGPFPGLMVHHWHSASNRPTVHPARPPA